jgi:Fibronectin type III domain
MKTRLVLPLVLTIAVIAPFGASVGATPAQAAAPQPTYGVTWVADTAANSLSEYAAGATGAATPVATISGASTHLTHPTGVTVDPAGNIYASNAGSNAITEYAVGANHNVAPTATISGAATALDAPSSISYGNDQLWVTDPDSNLVEAFTAGETGNVLPAEAISGSKTKLNHPVSLSASGEDSGIWVVNAPASGSPSVTEYGTGGDVPPDARIAGSRTGLVTPDGVSIDGFDSIWVTDRSTNRVSEYSQFSFGGANQKPDVVITGSATKLDGPSGISTDALERLTVANAGDRSVRVFAASAHGDAAPVRSITGVGSATGTPNAVDSFGAVPGAPTHVHVVAHSGSASVTWKSPVQTGGGIAEFDVVAFPIPTNPSGSFLTSGEVFETTHTSFTERHLTNGVKYQFQVSAVNAFGEGDSVQPVTATPIGDASAPRGITAVPGRGAIKVFWGSPATNGGEPIMHYRVQYATCAPGVAGCAFRTRVTPKASRHLTITGLPSGTQYRVRVLAQTSHGLGKPSRTATTRVV